MGSITNGINNVSWLDTSWQSGDDSIFMITAVANGANDYCTFRKIDHSQAGYTPSVGKKFEGISGFLTGDTAQAIHQIGYADNDIGWKVATAPTNMVDRLSAGNDGYHWVLDRSTKMPVALKGFTIPNAKYGYMRIGGGAWNLTILGREVDV